METDQDKLSSQKQKLTNPEEQLLLTDEESYLSLKKLQGKELS